MPSAFRYFLSLVICAVGATAPCIARADAAMDPERQALWDQAKPSRDPNLRCIRATKEHPALPAPDRDDFSKEAILARTCPRGYAPIGLRNDPTMPPAAPAPLPPDAAPPRNSTDN